MDRITVANDHGTFTTTPMRFDLAVARYLPASVNELRDKIEERFHTTKYRNLGTVTELLMVLASYDQPSDMSATGTLERLDGMIQEAHRQAFSIHTGD